MIVIPKWLKALSDAEREKRRNQRHMTSDEAREQYLRIQRESNDR